MRRAQYSKDLKTLGEIGTVITPSGSSFRAGVVPIESRQDGLETVTLGYGGVSAELYQEDARKVESNPGGTARALSESERGSICQALRIAIETFKQSVNALADPGAAVSSVGRDFLVRQFKEQIDEMEALTVLLQNAEFIHLGDVVLDRKTSGLMVRAEDESGDVITMKVS